MSTLLIRHSNQLQNAKPASNAISPKAIVGFCMATIVFVSSLDIWFAVQNESIMIVEQNPVCLALMKLDPGGFTFFIAGKASGTALVIIALLLLHLGRYRHAMTVTFGVTAFQLGLLVYLTLSDPTMYHLPNFSLLFADTPESIWELK